MLTVALVLILAALWLWCPVRGLHGNEPHCADYAGRASRRAADAGGLVFCWSSPRTDCAI